MLSLDKKVYNLFAKIKVLKLHIKCVELMHKIGIKNELQMKSVNQDYFFQYLSHIEMSQCTELMDK